MQNIILGFRQDKAIELGLHLDDLIILRYLTDFFPKMIKITDENKIYFWVDYKYLIHCLPILYKNAHNLNKTNFDRLVKKNVLSKKQILNPKELKRSGLATFYAFSINYYIIQVSQSTPEQGSQSTPEQGSQSTPEIIRLSNYINNNKEKIYKKESLQKNEFRTNSERKYTQEQLNDIFNDMYDYDNLNL